MTAREKRVMAALAVAFVALAFLPALGNAYVLTLGISMAMYGVLATSWAMFSGPTHYISLATAAFYGLGAYTMASGIEHLPYAVLVLISASAAACSRCWSAWLRCACRACTS